MRVRSHVGLAILVCLLCHPRTVGAAVQWEPVGLGGGGAMFTPAISPADGKLMMVNCDMSGAYISADGGASWQMIPCSQLRSNTACRPAFHPTERETVFAASGGGGRWRRTDSSQAVGASPVVTLNNDG